MTSELPPSQVLGIPWGNFERETLRKATFKLYPEFAIKSPDDLFEAGFIYIGNGVSDKVICYFCYAVKEDWRPDDEIQAAHNGRCPMAAAVAFNNIADATNARAVENAEGSSINSSTAEGRQIPTPSSGTRVFSPSGQNSQQHQLPGMISQTTTRFKRMSLQQNAPSNQQQYPWPGAHSQANTTIPHQRQFAPGNPPTQTQFNQFNTAGATRSNDTRGNHQNNQNQSSSNTPQPSPYFNTSSDMNNVDVRQGHHSGVAPFANQSARESPSEIGSFMTRSPYPIPPYPSAPPLTNNIQYNHNHQAPFSSQTSYAPANNRSSNTGQPPSVSHESSTMTRNGSYRGKGQGPTYADLAIITGRPKYPEYAVLSSRIESFGHDWPKDSPVKSEDVAKAGMFHRPDRTTRDRCQCFYCGRVLKDWEPEDDPFVEHARWYPHCDYIHEYLGSDFVKAVQELKNLPEKVTHERVKQHMLKKGMSLEKEFDEVTVEDDAAVKSLVDAGYDKEAVCKVAKKILADGDPLSADVILAKLSQTERSKVHEMPLGSGETNHTHHDVDELKEQNYALRNNLTCKICMDKEVKIIFLPCGHFVCCQECAVAMQKCPVCRNYIRGTVRASTFS